jgi:hypothetical protein
MCVQTPVTPRKSEPMDLRTLLPAVYRVIRTSTQRRMPYRGCALVPRPPIGMTGETGPSRSALSNQPLRTRGWL